MNKKKIFSLVLAAALAFGTTTAFAQESGAPSETETVTVTAESKNSSGDTYSEGVLNYNELDDGTYEVSGVKDETVTEVTISAKVNGKNVTKIGNSAFWQCDRLTSVKIPDSVTDIGISAFGRCTSLTAVKIPENNVYIDWSAFLYCENLRTVTLPRVFYMDDSAFEGCGISDVYYGGTPNEWEGIKTSVLANTRGNEDLFNAKIHCAMQDDTYTEGLSSETTAHTEYSGSNIGDNSYPYYWAQCVRSYLSETSDGFMRVQSNAVENKILVEYYTDGFKFKSSKLIDRELPLFGCFYETENNYYILSGQTNYYQDNSVEVFRVTKYDKNWKRLGSASLYGANTTVPFYAGNARMTHKANILAVRTCHEMYASGDGLNHQANVTILIDTDTMTVTDSACIVSNIDYGYCSHSFNQFIDVDGNNIVAIDHGDARPRCVVLVKYNSDIASNRLSVCSYASMFPISGATGDNKTGVEIGGFEVTDSAYIVAGTSIDQSNNSSHISNVFVSSLNSELEISFITDYSEDGTLSAANPHLVKVSDKKLILLWQLCRGSSVIKNTVYYTFLDDTGKQISDIKQITANLSDCKPIVDGDRVVWYTWDKNTVTFTSVFCDYPQPGTSFTENGLLYTVLDDGTLEVSCPDDNKETLTSAAIPSVLRGMKVTSIGEKAFLKCKNLTSVTIPDSITTIKNYGFNCCFALKSITLPESIVEIGEGVFSDCTALKSVTVPGSIANLNNYSFYRCDNLESVVINSGVTNIGSNAFSYCPKLSSVKIPAGVKKIDNHAFEWCTALKSATIPDGVTSIGFYAFYNCGELTSISIPKSVTYINPSAFDFCTGVTEYKVDINNPNYCSSDGVLFNKDKSELIHYPLGNKRMQYKIPGGVVNLGSNSLSHCMNLTYVVIPEGVTVIGEYAFCGSENIVSIVIPQSVESIYQSAFDSCAGLKNVYYAGTKEQWFKVGKGYANDPLQNAAIHYNSTGPTGTPVEVTIKAPDRVDVSGQTATVTVNGETKQLTITNGLLDVSGLADGTYTFTFSAKNCVPRAYNVTVANGAANGLDGGVELYLLGDINGDGSIKMADVRLAFKATRNSSELTEYQFAVADASKDGSVKMADVRAIYKHTRGESLWK